MSGAIIIIITPPPPVDPQGGTQTPAVHPGYAVEFKGGKPGPRQLFRSICCVVAEWCRRVP